MATLQTMRNQNAQAANGAYLAMTSRAAIFSLDNPTLLGNGPTKIL